MKSNFVKTGALGLLLMTVLFTACSKDEAVDDASNESSELTADQSRVTAQTDESVDGTFSILDVAYAEIEEDAGRNASLFSDCVTITISSENDVTFVTLDFGFGCELNNGAVVSGKINMTYGPIVAQTRTITYSFDDFVYNNKGLEGGGSIFRERTNDNGNPQSTFSKDIDVTFPSGIVAQVEGTRVREWIEGLGSGTWTDNVFSVTGNRNIEASTGFTQDAQVIEALRRETTCPYFVSGSIQITRNNGEGVLDFGSGDCDNTAILTVNGEEIVIVLN